MNNDIYIQALESTASPVTIADITQPDHPLVFCNQAFIDLTGYSKEEIIGKNCRFLQGDDTDESSVRKIRSSIAGNKESTETLLNYKKDGTPFWNDLILSPIHAPDGTTTHYVGFQVDITQRLEKERSNDLVDKIQKEFGAEEKIKMKRHMAILKIKEAANKISDLSIKTKGAETKQLDDIANKLIKITEELNAND